MKACMQNLPFKNHFSERASKCMFLSTSGREPRTRLRNIVKLLQQDWRFTFLRRISPVFTLTTCASTLNQGQRFLLTMWENSNWNQFFFQLFHFIATFNATAILGKLIFGRSNIFIFEIYFLHQFLDVCERRKKYYLPWFIVWIQPRTEWAWLAAGLLQVFHSPQNCQDSWIIHILYILS